MKQELGIMESGRTQLGKTKKKICLNIPFSNLESGITERGIMECGITITADKN